MLVAVTSPVYLPELVLYAGDPDQVYQRNAIQQSIDDIKARINSEGGALKARLLPKHKSSLQ